MSRPPSLLQRLVRARGGATAVEFGIILPALLLLLLGIAEAGRAYWMQSALNFATEEAARCAVIQATAPAPLRAPCDNATDTAAYAAAKAPQLQLTGANFTVNTASACGALVTAQMSYQFLMLPAFKGLTLQARACHA